MKLLDILKEELTPKQKFENWECKLVYKRYKKGPISEIGDKTKELIYVLPDINKAQIMPRSTGDYIIYVRSKDVKFYRSSPNGELNEFDMTHTERYLYCDKITERFYNDFHILIRFFPEEEMKLTI